MNLLAVCDTRKVVIFSGLIEDTIILGPRVLLIVWLRYAGHLAQCRVFQQKTWVERTIWIEKEECGFILETLETRGED
jgi:hypothetical protein